MGLLLASLVSQLCLIGQLRPPSGVGLGLLRPGAGARIVGGRLGLGGPRLGNRIGGPLVRAHRQGNSGVRLGRLGQIGATRIGFTAPSVIGGMLIVPRPPIGVLLLLTLPGLAFPHHRGLTRLPIGGIGRLMTLLLEGAVQRYCAGQILPRHNRLAIQRPIRQWSTMDIIDDRQLALVIAICVV